METDALIAYVTCPPDQAESLAQVLIECRAAACVNIVPAVQSIYRWQGKMQRDTEALLIIKSTARQVEALRSAVLQHHPYELPEFIVVKVAQGHPEYLQWIHDATHSH